AEAADDQRRRRFTYEGTSRPDHAIQAVRRIRSSLTVETARAARAVRALSNTKARAMTVKRTAMKTTAGSVFLRGTTTTAGVAAASVWTSTREASGIFAALCRCVR